MKTHLPPDDFLDLGHALSGVENCAFLEKYGKVVQLTGNLIEAEGVKAALGDICRILVNGDSDPIYAEVVGFHRRRLKLSPLTALAGICPGNLVQAHNQVNSIPVSRELLGRILDGIGQPIDGKGPHPGAGVLSAGWKSVQPPGAPHHTGPARCGRAGHQRLACPSGKGQRIGIFSGSGVGKSTLLSMMARFHDGPGQRHCPHRRAGKRGQ